MINEKVTGIILAGGKSSRMGADKAMLIYKGKPLISHAVAILENVCHRIVISSKQSQYTFTGCETWPDEMPVEAAIAGIYTCLDRSDTAYNFILSTDMPLIQPDFLLKMLKQRGKYDLILPVHNDGTIEPLCGIYSRNLLPLLYRNIEAEKYGLRHLPEQCNCRLIQTGDLQRTFLNVNTSVDFDLLNNS